MDAAVREKVLNDTITSLQSQLGEMQNQNKLLNNRIDELLKQNGDLNSKLDQFLKSQAANGKPTNKNTTLARNSNKRTLPSQSSVKNKAARTNSVANYFGSSSNDGIMDLDDGDESDENSKKTNEANDNNKKVGAGSNVNVNITSQNEHAESWANVVLQNNARGTTGITKDNDCTKTTPIQLGKYNSAKYGETVALLNQMKNGASPRILANNPDIKNKILELLDNNGIEYNTYREKNEKKKAYIVRGLCYGNDQTNIDGIFNALSTVGIREEITVSRFVTGYMKRNPDAEHTLLYQVIISGDQDDSRLVEIKSINSFHVRFERMKKSSIIQCKRCQRYSHTAGTCGYFYRCVQCTLVHQPGECPRMNNEKLPIGCINCKGHKMNYRGHTANDHQHCQFFAKFINKNGGETANENNTHKNTSNQHSGGPSKSLTSSHTNTIDFDRPTGVK